MSSANCSAVRPVKRYLPAQLARSVSRVMTFKGQIICADNAQQPKIKRHSSRLLLAAGYKKKKRKKIKINKKK